MDIPIYIIAAVPLVLVVFYGLYRNSFRGNARSRALQHTASELGLSFTRRTSDLVDSPFKALIGMSGVLPEFHNVLKGKLDGDDVVFFDARFYRVSRTGDVGDTLVTFVVIPSGTQLPSMAIVPVKPDNIYRLPWAKRSINERYDWYCERNDVAAPPLQSLLSDAATRWYIFVDGDWVMVGRQRADSLLPPRDYVQLQNCARDMRAEIVKSGAVDPQS